MSDRIVMPPGSGLPEGFQNMGMERDDPEGHVYQPPTGAPILKAPAAGMFYNVAPPSQQTDRLQPYERRYIIPIALAISPIFDVVPIPDDVYRKTPEQAKLSNLFCIMSRSGINRDSSGTLEWDAIVVVIRKFCQVRITCHLHPTQDVFYIRRVHLWSRLEQKYHVIDDDPHSIEINPEVLPVMLDQYVAVEKING